MQMKEIGGDTCCPGAVHRLAQPDETSETKHRRWRETNPGSEARPPANIVHITQLTTQFASWRRARGYSAHCNFCQDKALSHRIAVNRDGQRLGLARGKDLKTQRVHSGWQRTR